LRVSRSARGHLSVHGERAPHPAREADGLVWTYLGPPGVEPPFPAYDWTQLPREQLAHMKYVLDEPWQQVGAFAGEFVRR